MMKTYAIIPVKRFENAKTRLSSILDTDDRIHLSLLMLEDTLQILSVVHRLSQVIIVSADKSIEEIAAKYGAKFLLEEKERGVNSAVALANNYCMKKKAADATIVIPHDLPLLEKHLISRALMHDIDTPEDAFEIMKEETVTARSLEFIKSKF
jgi:2-phospho-L-lactate guanylyltransferase